MIMMRHLICIVLIIGACCLGCDREDDSTTVKVEYVYDVKVYITGDRPALVVVKYTAVARGCASVHDPVLKPLGGNSYHIHARYVRASGGGFFPCSDEYDQYVMIRRLEPGQYTVSINEYVFHFEVPPEPGCQTIEFEF